MTELMSTIYIVTPSYNAEETIDHTILSVVTQAGNFKIRYHVQDGGSTDGTLLVLQEWKSRLDSANFPILCGGVDFTYDSAPDGGMYEAITKGFARFVMRPSDFMAWINADDIYLPGAFALVAAVAAKYTADQISWVGGGTSIMRNDRHINQGERPNPTSVIKSGICDGTHWHFVQQEGTFFRYLLWVLADGPTVLQNLKLAGDWNLWRVFAHHAQLFQAPFGLGSFRLREGQLSSNLNAYLAEINSIVPLQARIDSFKEIGQQPGGPARNIIRARWPSGELYVVKKTGTGALFERYKKAFGARPPIPWDDGSEVEIVF